MNGIFIHDESKHKYKKIDIQQNNGKVVEKFVYINGNGKPVMDKGNYIYLNKNTGDIITGNGKKYVVNGLTKQLAITPNGYIIEEKNNNNFSGLPRRINSLSIAPNILPKSQLAPAGMMRAPQSSPLGGFIVNRKPNSHVLVPKGSKILSYSGSILTSGPAPSSNLVPTVFGPPKTSKNPGFKN